LRRQARDLEDARGEDLHLAERRRQPRRHDAGHLPRLTVECDGLAHERRAAAEARLPQLVADDADRGTVGQILVRGEIAADRRQDTERRKERAADAQAVQLLGIAVAGQREIVERRVADRAERVRVLAKLLVPRPRDGGRVQVDLRVVGPDGHQRRGIRNRHRVEDKPIVDGEQRRVRGDADRDRQHGDDRERRALPERADGLLEIRHQQVSSLKFQVSGLKTQDS
jgi:hypothetical protein